MNSGCLSFLSFIICMCFIASCSAPKQVYAPEKDEPVFTRPYDGERTSVVLKMYADTNRAALRRNGFYQRLFEKLTPLYLPDSTYDMTKLNPFGPSFMFYFAISKPDYINMNLKDPARDSVKYLILQDSLPRGIYTMQFQRLDVQSGVYFVEFKNRDTVVQRKAVFIK